MSRGSFMLEIGIGSETFIGIWDPGFRLPLWATRILAKSRVRMLMKRIYATVCLPVCLATWFIDERN